MLRPLRYILFFTLPGVIATVFLSVSYLVLERSGETIDPIAAASIQQHENIPYGSALFYRPRPYKIERTRLARADIILLGSSRAMQFVSQPWKVSTYNAGGAMRDIETGEFFVDQVLKVYRPKKIIIALDWWWLSANRRPDEAVEASGETPLTLHELLQPTSLLWNGTLSAPDIDALLFHPSEVRPAIGLAAKFRYAGWDSFGHYDYGDMLTVPAGGTDIDFKSTLKDLQRQSRRNDRGPQNPFSEVYWKRLDALVERLQSDGVDVILFLPPVTGKIRDWLAAQPEPNLVKEVQRRLLSLPVPTFDFHDPDVVGTNPCEFVDGVHGGEVTYLRVLKAIASSPATNLGASVDQRKIDDLIAGNSGHASLANNDADRRPEVDFNSLGCAK